MADQPPFYKGMPKFNNNYAKNREIIWTLDQPSLDEIQEGTYIT